jgi:hypothetical protein
MGWSRNPHPSSDDAAKRRHKPVCNPRSRDEDAEGAYDDGSEGEGDEDEHRGRSRRGIRSVAAAARERGRIA